MKRPGEGDRKCMHGGTCGNWVVDGLGACILHVPDDDLEEAEEVTGVRRCRRDFGTPDACRRYAVANTEPPACDTHGANRGSNTWKGAIARGVENRLSDRLAAIMAEGGEYLLRPPAIEDPLSEMLDLAAEVKALKELMRFSVADLVAKNQVRYSNAKVGEQVRAELLLYERALERTAKILTDISKMRIEERLAGVQEKTADMIERAVNAALEESGVTLEGQVRARKAFRRHLKVVQGTLAS